MSPAEAYVILLSTAPSAEIARSLAQRLVDVRLAACVTIVPGVTSVYRWQDAVTTDDELMLVVKTRAALADAAIRALVEAHPYEVPEAVVLPLAGGHEPYLEWIAGSTG